MFKNTWMLLAAVLFAASLSAQIQPSNIYVFEMKKLSDTTYAFNKPRYLTSFNSNGYNNQPEFFDANKLYITAQLPFDNQSDLYELNLDNQTKVRVTETPEGEFSPKLMPTRYQFSAIRQEISGRDTLLRLWEFPMDRLSNGKPVFKYLNGIGYYQWLNSTQVAVFMTTNPSTLGIADTRTDEVENIATNVGRCFKRLSNGNMAYVQKSDFENWYIMEKKLPGSVSASQGSSRFGRSTQPTYSSGSNEALEDLPVTQVIETLPGSEDFEIHPDGSYLMALGSKIYRYNPRRDEDWREIGDFKYFGIRNITRLALSRDNKLAIVGN